ncbi:glycosyltransferase family 2 protein [Desulfoplanes formicivorans]|uniref:Glycosyltransferase 2-like domain-containing protein n=1 Tax=Desulfoplanes formicivorans TaxID=1592317 RepID=A0A194AJ90_9BACT|nr:glycosyltransferase family 2 protein [Desulfoplanes formicivorans]GAU09388.1 hypothetical protein DPF_2114 [Desulfoplanes formicivorans]
MSYAVSIIIPVFNQWHLTCDCLVSLQKTILRSDIEIIVVDNGSSDATMSQCPKLGTHLFGQRFTYIRNEENRNFGPACNQGARQASAKYLFFLNNDTIAKKGWLEPLLESMGKDDRLGAVSPLLVYPDSERVQHLGVTFAPGGTVKHLYEYFPKDHPVVYQERELQAITGAAFFIDRGEFLRCGSFFEGYANGFEDLDLCFELRAHGKTLRCIPESCFVHLTSQTPGRFDCDTVNAALLSRRHGHDLYPDLHVLVRNDGFCLNLTSWLMHYATLPKERRSTLEKEAHGMDSDALTALLHKEPLWEDGYERLARLREQQGDHAAANQLRWLRVRLCPSEKAYFLLQKSSQRCHDDLLYDYAKNFLAFLAKNKDKHQRTKMISRARSLQAWARAHDESGLVTLYEQWLGTQ